jgi:hypothetical protein
MTLNQFIEQNNIQPGDAVVAKKDNIGLLDHYLIYLGQNYHSEHIFMANYFQGTRILSYEELNWFSQSFSPTRIRRFKGNDLQRNAAVQRALSRKDQDSYHLLLNNCEHFVTYAQEGKAHSQQTNVFGAGMAVTGLAVAASSKNDVGKSVGATMAILGFLTLMMNND